MAHYYSAVYSQMSRC